MRSRPEWVVVLLWSTTLPRKFQMSYRIVVFQLQWRASYRQNSRQNIVIRIVSYFLLQSATNSSWYGTRYYYATDDISRKCRGNNVSRTRHTKRHTKRQMTTPYDILWHIEQLLSDYRRVITDDTAVKDTRSPATDGVHTDIFRCFHVYLRLHVDIRDWNSRHPFSGYQNLRQQVLQCMCTDLIYWPD